jgi:hypothetical protein
VSDVDPDVEWTDHGYGEPCPRCDSPMPGYPGEPPVDRLAAALHVRHLGCWTNYRGEFACDGRPERHRPDADAILAALASVGVRLERT